MTFFLGTHKPAWLARTDVQLFVSRRTLAPIMSLPRALGSWALDSGGFSELSMYGGYRTTARDYAAEVYRFNAEVGLLEWAAIQDWMCEPFMLGKTGLCVAEHQRRTVMSLLTLRNLNAAQRWTPVLQGYTLDDYLRHWELYEAHGVDLRTEPVVGLGSVCRRQGMADAERIVERLAHDGLRLHAFGFKLRGLRNVAHLLTSADSMAWSYDARRGEPLPGCTHKRCNNCLRYAEAWREKAMQAVHWPKQRAMVFDA